MNKFIVIIRPAFMQFCKDACRAAAFNHLLYRIAGKSKDQLREKIQAGDILWYAKTEQITEEMANAWGTCKVRKEVNGLIAMGLIGRRSNPAWGADRTKHFCFGTDQCARFLQFCAEHNICVVHLDLPPEVLHLIYSSNANDTSIKCICENHQMEAIDISNANDTSIRAITEDSPTEIDFKDDDKEEGTGASAPPARAEISDLKEKISDTAARLKAIGRTEQPAASDGWQASPVTDDEDELEKTVKRPAIQAPTQTVRGANAAPGIPPASESRASGSKIPKRPKAAPVEPKAPPVMPAEDAAWNTRTCLQLFDYWRGAYLIGKFELMQASTCAKEMVAQYSRAEVTEAKTKMDKDKYWMERGGADVCNVGRQIHRYVRRGKAPAQAAIDDDPYSFASILKRQEEQERASARGN